MRVTTLLRPILCSAVAAFAMAAQAQQSTSSPIDLPESIRSALAATTDFTFSYDNAGLISLLEYLKAGNPAPGHTREPVTITRWADLLEHPADFRGLPITITGVVGRNSAWRFQQPERAYLGEIHELQLSAADQPIVCKSVLTQDASDIPIGASVTVTGWFLTIQQFYSETNRLCQAAVLVGVGPTQVMRSTARSETPSATTPSIFGILAVITIGLLVGWVVLRSAASRTPRDVHQLRAQHAAPLNLSEDIATWARDETDRPPT